MSILGRIKLILGGPCLVAVGLVVFSLGSDEKRLADTAAAQPQEMTLRQLIDRGPEGNPHIILSDFEFAENMVIEKKEKSERWTKVWVPMTPLEVNLDGPPKPSSVRAILLSKNVTNNEGLAALEAKPKLNGLVTNLIDKLGYKEKQLLANRYPGTNFEKCIIFEEGREPASTMKVYLYWAIGGAIVLAGIGCFIYGFLPHRDGA
jgi:hypothetical protein